MEEFCRYVHSDLIGLIGEIIASNSEHDDERLCNQGLYWKLILNIINKNPSKFRLNTVDQNLNKYVFLNFGTHSFLNTKFHYNNGLSVQHNSGFYLEHSSEDYRFQSPNYKNLNGELLNSIKLYSNRFLNTKLLETSFTLILASRFAFLRSKINCAKSSME